MKQKLHPKAVWLFFINYLFDLAIGLFVFGFLWILFFTAPIYTEVKGPIQGVVNRIIAIFPWGWAIFALIIYLIFSYILAKLTYRFWCYQLTEDSLRIERGVIWKKYISIPYERIQNVDIYRGLLARFIGLSDLHIQTAGYSFSGTRGIAIEGRLLGLDSETAEQLREDLIKRAKGSRQGL